MQNKSKKNLQNLKILYYLLILGPRISKTEALKPKLYHVWQKEKQHFKQGSLRVDFLGTYTQ